MKINSLRAGVFSFVFAMATSSLAGGPDDLLRDAVQNNNVANAEQAMAMDPRPSLLAQVTEFLKAWQAGQTRILIAMVAYGIQAQTALLDTLNDVFARNVPQFHHEIRHLRILQRFAELQRNNPAQARAFLAHMRNHNIQDNAAYYELSAWMLNLRAEAQAQAQPVQGGGAGNCNCTSF
jgi:hypothetical protein